VVAVPKFRWNRGYQSGDPFRPPNCIDATASHTRRLRSLFRRSSYPGCAIKLSYPSYVRKRIGPWPILSAWRGVGAHTRIHPGKTPSPHRLLPFSKVALKMVVSIDLHFHANPYLLSMIPFFTSTAFPDRAPETELIKEVRAQACCHKSGTS